MNVVGHKHPVFSISHCDLCFLIKLLLIAQPNSILFSSVLFLSFLPAGDASPPNWQFHVLLTPVSRFFESPGLSLTDLYPFHKHRADFPLHVVCLRFYETVEPSTEMLHLAIAILVCSSMMNTDLCKRLDSSKPDVRRWRLDLLFLSYSQTSLGFSTSPEQGGSTGSLLWDSFWCLALVYFLPPAVHLLYFKVLKWCIYGIKLMY